MRVFFSLFSFAATCVAQPYTPSETAELLRQKNNSPDLMTDLSKLPPACASVTCADVVTHCTQAQVFWPEGQCCPLCGDESYVPAVKLDTTYIVPTWAGADPVKCANVKCFQQVCPSGQKIASPSGGGCCEVCKA